MPHISQNPIVREIFDEFSLDTQYWVNQHLSPESLDSLIRGKADILIKNHPQLKQVEIAYLTDCFNTVYQVARQINIHVPRPVVSVLDLIKPKPVEAKMAKATKDHGTQTDQ